MPSDGQRQPTPFGPFLLERRIAVGGSAEVFLARPKAGTRPAPRLVIKRLLPSAREGGGFGALEHEADLHRAVSHPNVVRIFGAGMVGDEPFLAMEYVDGVDLYRLLRRAESEERGIPPGLAAYVGGRVAAALAAVHEARDAEGKPLGVVHRDVTPSNIYLSVEGEVKLGDFGIARVSRKSRASTSSEGQLKGKFGYLAPEQVAGEAFDHRADLFALGAVVGEMLIGERVFPGSGQLAVLLAIRDGNVEPLRRAEARVPPGLYALCLRALETDPEKRFQTAAELAAELGAFEHPSAGDLVTQLAEWVSWARDSSGLARHIEGKIKDSVQRMRAVREAAPASSGDPEPSTVRAEEVTAEVRKKSGEVVGSMQFAKLIEMIVTGELDGDDEVSLMKDPMRRIRDIEQLARHLLPSTTTTTAQLFEPGIPDYTADVRDTPMLDVLARMRRGSETGVLFVERWTEAAVKQRKEMYLKAGRLLHVASTEPAELLGERLVKRGSITREELGIALAVLPRFGGRLGDTLIGLGLVEATDVFRAIRDQGRDRVAGLCGWTDGKAAFYRGVAPGEIQFPLDLDLASPMMAGVLVASSGDPMRLLSDTAHRLEPGPRLPTSADRAERGTVPSSMAMIPALATRKATLREAIDAIHAPPNRADARRIGESEAVAALVTARALGWVAF